MKPAALLLALFLTISLHAQQKDWPVTGGTPENTRYSTLSQINRGNVKDLTLAWSYDTGEKGGLQTTPIIVGRTLYAYTPTQEVIALEAATGKLLWKFRSGIDGTQPDRGLAYWSSGSEHRLLAGIMNYVYALDPASGRPIQSFGDHGRIDLRDNLRGDPKLQSIVLTSPGVIYKDLLIVGGREPETLPAPPGDIRAYDVRTGRLRWSFHTIPHPGEYGYNTWPKDAWTYSGGANNWGGMALDPVRGIVYVPTGSAADDFYGANRVGDDLFADTLLALDASTGKRLWHFQGVHHDLWDRDFPSPPTLVTLHRGGKTIPALAQTTKQGFVYVFNRVTGQSLFPIELKSYPPSTVPGEVAAKQQPLPTRPAPFSSQLLTEANLTNRTPEAHQWALKRFRSFTSNGQFVPLSVDKNTIIYPGTDGGAEWGGSAVDPTTGILYVNANNVAIFSAMARHTSAPGGRGIYQSQCSVCHGENRQGSPPVFPSLIDIRSRLTEQQIAATIHNGRGRMPGFPQLSGDQVDALIKFLERAPQKELPSIGTPAADIAYNSTGYNWFRDPDGYPATAPPWGTLNAINLATGDYAWKIPFGEYPKLAAQGFHNTGTDNYGGPIVTAGGLVFIGATSYDRQFHAYDKSTGKLLWHWTLPFAGNATPATYQIDGRQYIVIAAGGGKDLTSPSGGTYQAFALPK